MKQISVTECTQMIQQQKVTIVDIRDPNSFAQGHISGAHHVDNQNIQDFIRDADLDLPLVVCCYHGHSSIPAAQYLEQQGFKQVYSLDGGMCGWMLSQEL
ncbi:MAG: thiosulfate sulfurtransferase GlpE [Gammaproteobacteria bacterium CG22_combo_CG10-13_8_21_14_all_40_8]|nr:MAG: thiosulfate sulfurtransferase GlpE [Gammaproteobacteria bacterium CG22_combo_CG10-13_8_21_14_all_40_8]